MNPLHFRCECGAHATASTGTEDIVRRYIKNHVRLGHTVKSWRRGNRDQATTHVPESLTGRSWS